MQTMQLSKVIEYGYKDSLDLVEFLAAVSSFQQCASAINNTERHDILVKLKINITPSEAINSNTGSLIRFLFEGSEEIKSVYINLTKFATVAQPEEVNGQKSCHQNDSSAVNRQLFSVLENTSTKISAYPHSMVDFNCANEAVSSGNHSFNDSK